MPKLFSIVMCDLIENNSVPIVGYVEVVHGQLPVIIIVYTTNLSNTCTGYITCTTCSKGKISSNTNPSLHSSPFSRGLLLSATFRTSSKKWCTFW